ncbi:MAG: tRNA (adenosine(37)-N6)-threonylcarbamoyltransferase complex dimerization subunit type 1 TsaB [Pseudomonadota bacterium]
MKLLAIEAATEACSAAVLVDDEVIEQYQLAPRKHNEILLPMCEQVLAEMELSISQLDIIAFGCGPGAFTGVRIAAGVAQGIAFAHDLPAASVSTLANLACQSEVEPDSLVIPAIDARMSEVYWAGYRKISECEAELELPEKVEAPESIRVEHTAIACGLGSGWSAYPEIMQANFSVEPLHIDPKALPRARTTALIGQQKALSSQLINAEKILPVYLRDNVAHKKI